MNVVLSGFCFGSRRIIILCLVFSCLVVSGNDSATKAFRIMGSAYAMANSYYSHHARTSVFRNSAKLSNKTYLPGYAVGITTLSGRSRSGDITLGISFSSSKGVSNSTVKKTVETARSEYTVYNTTMTSTVQVFFINYEVGYRLRIFKRLYFQPLFVFNDNLVLNAHERGIYTTVREFNDGRSQIVTSETSEDFDVKRKQYRGSTASVRATLWYDLKIGNDQFSLSAFRNFGIDFDIPWWGIGFSIIR